MKVKLADIKSYGRKYDFELLPMVDDVDYQIGFTGRGTTVMASFDVSFSEKKKSDEVNSCNGIRVEGNIKGVVEVICSRCGTVVGKSIDIAIERTFLPALEHKISGDEHQLSEEDLSIEFYQDDTIDLEHLAREELLLDMSSIYLCNDKCKNRCPDCGKKDEACECSLNAHDGNNYIKGLEKLRE